MKKRLIPILIALAVLIAGCTSTSVSSPTSESIYVYRVLSPEYQTDSKLLESESVNVDMSESRVIQAASAIAETPTNSKFASPLPKGVKILDAVLEDNCAVVYMNLEYLDVSGIDKTILDGCITLTMSSIEDVDFVSICVGSEVIEDKLSSEDFLLFDNIINSQQAQVRIYFPKYFEQSLGSEYHTISFDSENSAERGILDALFEGPASNNLTKPFPVGTIVLSVYTQDEVCSVSLSGITADDKSLTPANAKLAVYSIVNSLTSLSGIKRVQILIDGKQVKNLWGFDISTPLTKNESIIGSAVTE